jgi:Skp family chaperone for outer membrane proteins
VIAVANIEKIVQSIHEYSDINSEMDLQRKSLTATFQEKSAQINAMKQSLSYLKPDSPQFSDQEDKLLKASIAFDALQQETKLDLERKEKTKMRSLFLEISDAVAQIAQQDGIQIVISDQRPTIPDNMDQLTVDQVRAMISERNVLYSDASRDISGKVITLLDKNYAAKSAAPPVAPVAPPAP